MSRSPSVQGPSTTRLTLLAFVVSGVDGYDGVTGSVTVLSGCDGYDGVTGSVMVVSDLVSGCDGLLVWDCDLDEGVSADESFDDRFLSCCS